MARPIWTGSLSFGLLNVPVSLMSGERRADLSFRMLDARDNSPIRYERVNAETGEEVPWRDIVKAFEYDKGNYVVVEKEDIAAAAPESHESIDVEAFVDADAIGIRYFEKPYILTPGKKAEKGYVLLRETLRATATVGIARVVIRTREYICAVMPEGAALILMLLRYPQELVDLDEHALPEGGAEDYRVTAKELEMAEQLIRSMCSKWKPESYRDEFRERLAEVIRRRVKEAGGAAPRLKEPEPSGAQTDNVVDFMALLQKSLETKKRTPAASPRSATAGKPGKRSSSVKKSPAKQPGKAKSSSSPKAAPKSTRGKASEKSPVGKPATPKARTPSRRSG